MDIIGKHNGSAQMSLDEFGCILNYPMAKGQVSVSFVVYWSVVSVVVGAVALDVYHSSKHHAAITRMT